MTTPRRNCQNCGAVRHNLLDSNCDICGSTIFNFIDYSKLPITDNPNEGLFNEDGERLVAARGRGVEGDTTYYFKRSALNE